LEKGVPLHVNKIESPPLKDDLCQVWLKLARWFLRRSRKCKSLQTDRRQDGRTDRLTTDNRWSEKLAWAFSSSELKSKFYKFISKRRIISLMHSYILRQMWLNFMAQYLVFTTWVPLSSRKAHLVHQNWYRISFTLHKIQQRTNVDFDGQSMWLFSLEKSKGKAWWE
jgi:hypothetical protein